MTPFFVTEPGVRIVSQHEITQHARPSLCLRVHDREGGEGVISAAIAVLVMAFLGLLMWQLFQGTFQDAADRVDDQVGQIGS